MRSRHLQVLLCYHVTCAIYLFTIVQAKVTNYNMRNFISKESRADKNYLAYSRRYEPRANEDGTIYMSFAHNPFGPSTRFITKNTMAQNVSFPAPPTEGGPTPGVQGRTKRGVLQLYNMIRCSTSCDPISYKGYGCYCGFLGSGKPVDGIDRCCKKHDWCYNNAGCAPFFEYLVPYLWKCYRNRPLCALEAASWGGNCGRRLCECDRALSECLARQPCPSSSRPAICHSSPWRLLQNAFNLI